MGERCQGAGRDQAGRSFGWVFLALLAVLLVGCDDSTQDITLNPDGSARIVYTVSRPLDLAMGVDATAEPPEAVARRFALGLLKDSTGVEAWQAVSFGYEPTTRRVHFQGTAYCRDLNRVRFRSGEAFPSAERHLTFLRTPQGFELVLRDDQEAAAEAMPAPPAAAALDQRVAAARAQLARQLPTIEGHLAELRESYVIRLPAAPTRLVNFSPGEAAAVAMLVYDGPEMSRAIRHLMNDDAFWRDAARHDAGGAGWGSLPALNERLFGTRDFARIVLEGEVKPQFDYVAEVRVAQAGYADMVARLGLGEEAVSPATGDGFRALRMGGVRWIREADFAGGVAPFSGFPGYSLALIGEFHGTVLSVGAVTVEAALADTGQSRLARETYRRAPQLSKDGRTVTFEVQLAEPEAGVNGWRLITGHLPYTVAAGTARHELALQPLLVGKLDGPLPATIEKIADSAWRKGSKELVLRLDLANAGPLKEVQLYGPDGLRIELEPPLVAMRDGQTQVTLLAAGELPAAGRLTIVTHADVRTYRAPFILENLDLLGRPAGR